MIAPHRRVQAVAARFGEQSSLPIRGSIQDGHCREGSPWGPGSADEFHFPLPSGLAILHRRHRFAAATCFAGMPGEVRGDDIYRLKLVLNSGLDEVHSGHVI